MYTSFQEHVTMKKQRHEKATAEIEHDRLTLMTDVLMPPPCNTGEQRQREALDWMQDPTNPDRPLPPSREDVLHAISENLKRTSNAATLFYPCACCSMYTSERNLHTFKNYNASDDPLLRVLLRKDSGSAYSNDLNIKEFKI